MDTTIKYADTFTCPHDSAYSANIKLPLKYGHPTNLYCRQHLGHQHNILLGNPPDELDISRPQENGRLFYIANYDNAQVSLVPLPQSGSPFTRQSRKLSPPGGLGKVTCIQNLPRVVLYTHASRLYCLTADVYLEMPCFDLALVSCNQWA